MSHNFSDAKLTFVLNYFLMLEKNHVETPFLNRDISILISYGNVLLNNYIIIKIHKNLDFIHRFKTPIVDIYWPQRHNQTKEIILKF